MGIFLQKKEKVRKDKKGSEKKTSHINKNVTVKMQLYIRFDLALAQISNIVKLLSICECFSPVSKHMNLMSVFEPEKA